MLKFLKSLFNGTKVFDQRGVVHLLPLLILLAGIIGGVYLVQKSGYQIFKPKAAGEEVEIQATDGQDANGNPCFVKKEDGKLKTNCPEVKIKFTSPLEIQGSSDAGPNMSFVKTTYADSSDGYNLVGDKCSNDPDNADKLYDKQDQEVSTCRSGETCRTIDFKGLIVGFGKDTKAFCFNSSGFPVIEDSSWKCESNKREIYQEGAFLGFFNVKKIPCPTGTECSQGGNRVTCVPIGQQVQVPPGQFTNIAPQGDVYVRPVGPAFTWSEVPNATRYRFIVDSKNLFEGKRFNDCPSGYSDHFRCSEKFIDGSFIIGTVIVNRKTLTDIYRDGGTYTWWVDALDENGDVIATTNAFGVTIHKLTAQSNLDQRTIQWFCRDNKIWRLFYSEPDKSNKTEVVQDGENCDDNDQECTEFLNPVIRQHDAKCEPKGISPTPAPTPALTPTPVPTPRATPRGAPVPTPAAPAPVTVETRCIDDPVTPPANYKWAANCNKTCQTNADCPKSTDQFVCPSTSNWCYDFAGNVGKRCLMLEYIGSRTAPPPGPGGPACPERPAPSETKVTTCKGESKTWAQIDAELRAANYDGVYDHSQAELDAYNRAACPAAGGPQPGVGATPPQPAQPEKRTTKSYRYAFSPAELFSAPWRPYTQQGGVVETITLSDSNPGLKYIFVEFQNDLGQIINDRYYTASIELVGPSAPTSQPPPPPPPPSQASPCDPRPDLANWRNYSAEKLLQCYPTYRELADLPSEVFDVAFSNSDVLKIANTQSDPYQWMADKLSSQRLSTFGLDVLRKLPQEGIDKLPNRIRDLITGKTATSQVTETAQCSEVKSVSTGQPGGVASITASFTGNPQTLELWMASNSEINNPPETVSSWTQVQTFSSPKSGNLYSFNVPTGMAVGNHAVLMALRASNGTMLDGNVGGRVNTNCTTTVSIISP